MSEHCKALMHALAPESPMAKLIRSKSKSSSASVASSSDKKWLLGSPVIPESIQPWDVGACTSYTLRAIKWFTSLSVYVWDCRKYFQYNHGDGPKKVPSDLELAQVPYTCPRWHDEIPEGSLIAVLHTGGAYNGLHELTLSLNLLGVLLMCLAPDPK